MLVTTTCIVIVVVMVRMIGSVVNKDEAYSGIISAVKEIYNSEGLLGFYRYY